MKNFVLLKNLKSPPLGSNISISNDLCSHAMRLHAHTIYEIFHLKLNTFRSIFIFIFLFLKLFSEHCQFFSRKCIFLFSAFLPFKEYITSVSICCTIELDWMLWWKCNDYHILVFELDGHCARKFRWGNVVTCRFLLEDRNYWCIKRWERCWGSFKILLMIFKTLLAFSVWGL